MNDQCEWLVWLNNKGHKPVRCKNNAGFVNLADKGWVLCQKHKDELLQSYNTDHRLLEEPKWRNIVAVEVHTVELEEK